LVVFKNHYAVGLSYAAANAATLGGPRLQLPDENATVEDGVGRIGDGYFKRMYFAVRNGCVEQSNNAQHIGKAIVFDPIGPSSIVVEVRCVLSLYERHQTAVREDRKIRAVDNKGKNIGDALVWKFVAAKNKFRLDRGGACCDGEFKLDQIDVVYIYRLACRVENCLQVGGI